VAVTDISAREALTDRAGFVIHEMLASGRRCVGTEILFAGRTTIVSIVEGQGFCPGPQLRAPEAP
jgi:hypothetical protein